MTCPNLSQPQESAPLSSAVAENNSRRILVVEDDADTREMNLNVLLGSGYQVDTAEDGAAAWDTLQARNYDLVVTDNDMPKVTGIELLKKLHAAGNSPPVIMATGALPLEVFARNPGLKPAATLTKPYTIQELLRTVEKVLREAGFAGNR